MSDYPIQVDIPVTLVKDLHVITSSMRAFAVHLVNEASTTEDGIVSLHFDRNNIFHLSAMLFQLITIAEGLDTD